MEEKLFKGTYAEVKESNSETAAIYLEVYLLGEKMNTDFWGNDVNGQIVAANSYAKRLEAKASKLSEEDLWRVS